MPKTPNPKRQITAAPVIPAKAGIQRQQRTKHRTRNANHRPVIPAKAGIQRAENDQTKK